MLEDIIVRVAHIAVVCCLFGNTATSVAGLKMFNGGQSLHRYGSMPTQVQLDDAHTQMKISVDGVSIQSNYVLQNVGKKRETLRVGFVSAFPDRFRKLSATVDGKRVDIESLKDDDGDDVRHWKVWTNTMDSGQQCTVGVSYELRYRLSEGDFIHHWLAPAIYTTVFLQPTLIEHEDADGKYEMARKMRVMEFGYDLISASAWSGPVGKYTIEVVLDGLSTDNIPFAYKGGGLSVTNESVVTDRIVWTQSQFEPKQNFGLALTPNITRTQLDKLLEVNRKRFPTDPAAVMMSVGHRYLSGAKPEEIQSLVAELLRVWQTRVSRSGPDASATSVIVSTITQGIGLTDVPGYPKFFDATALVPEITTTIERLEGQRKRDGGMQSTEYDSILRWCRQQSRN